MCGSWREVRGRQLPQNRKLVAIVALTSDVKCVIQPTLACAASRRPPPQLALRSGAGEAAWGPGASVTACVACVAEAVYKTALPAGSFISSVQYCTTPAPPPPPMSDSVDPDVLALSQSLRALEVGTVPACLKFAKDLTDQGILTLERLKKLPQSEAIELLEGCGMKKLQVRTVIEAIAPAPAPAPASAAQKVCELCDAQPQ